MSPEFLGTYTTRFNRRHKLCGHLFSGRYKSLLVDGSTSGYLKAVCDYVHLNPVRAKGTCGAVARRMRRGIRSTVNCTLESQCDPRFQPRKANQALARGFCRVSP